MESPVQKSRSGHHDGTEGGNDVTDNVTDKWKLTPGKLRRLKDPGSWKVKGTDEWGPGRKGVGLIGQERAVESISFGLMVPGRGKLQTPYFYIKHLRFNPFAR